MWDLLKALGLVLAVEGILFAAFPDATRRAMLEAARSPRERVRLFGLLSAGVGVALIWFARG